MFPKRNRLTKKTEFAEVLGKGRMFQTGLFGVVILKTGGNVFPKVGIVVSNKISKLATKRNRAKRLLREAIKRKILGLDPGTKIVFLAKKTILKANLGAVLKEVEGFIKKTKTK